MVITNDAVEVRSSVLGLGVFVRREIPAGTVLVEGWGLPAPSRTRHSIQVDFEAHVLVDPPLVYVNHSCDPNCTAKIITISGEKKIVIYTKQDIELGDEITYGACSCDRCPLPFLRPRFLFSDYHFPIEQEKVRQFCSFLFTSLAAYSGVRYPGRSR